MITKNNTSVTVSIHESKIIHKRAILHTLAKYVTEEAVALKFNVKREEIHRIELWDTLVYVYAGKLSRFVSYADFPPILTENPPEKIPVGYWGERLRKLHQQDQRTKETKKEQLLNWWCKYYGDRLSESKNKLELRQWGEIIAILKPYLSDSVVNTLREIYALILKQYEPRNLNTTSSNRPQNSKSMFTNLKRRI